MIKVGTKYEPISNDMLDFNGNKVMYFEILGEDEDIKHNVKILVYPECGICSVDSIAESEVIDNSKFREI